MKRNVDLFLRGLNGFNWWKHKLKEKDEEELFWISMFLFFKSKETGEGEMKRWEGVGALARVSGEGEGGRPVGVAV